MISLEPVRRRLVDHAVDAAEDGVREGVHLVGLRHPRALLDHPLPFRIPAVEIEREVAADRLLARVRDALFGEHVRQPVALALVERLDAGGRREHEPVDQFRPLQRERDPDLPAHRVADVDERVEVERLDEAGERLGVERHVVRVRPLRRLPEARQIDGDDAVAGVGEVAAML